MKQRLDQLSRLGVVRFEKVEWVEYYMTARLEALTKGNIEGRWHGSGSGKGDERVEAELNDAWT